MVADEYRKKLPYFSPHNQKPAVNSPKPIDTPQALNVAKEDDHSLPWCSVDVPCFIRYEIAWQPGKQESRLLERVPREEDPWTRRQRGQCAVPTKRFALNGITRVSLALRIDILRLKNPPQVW